MRGRPGPAPQPIRPIEPADPIERIDPEDPIDRMDPLDPMDSSDPLDPRLRMDPIEATESQLATDSTDWDDSALILLRSEATDRVDPSLDGRGSTLAAGMPAG